MTNSMIARLSLREKSCAFLVAIVFAQLSFVLVQHLHSPVVFRDFIVGDLAWQLGTKLQDMVTIPVLVLTVLLVWLAFATALESGKNKFGIAFCDQLCQQLLLWSLPGVIFLASIVVGKPIGIDLLFLSISGLVFMIVAVGWQIRRHQSLGITPETVSIAALLVILVAYGCFSLPLFFGRLWPRIAGEPSVEGMLKLVFLVFIVFLLVYFVMAVLVHRPSWLKAVLPRALLISQLALSFFAFVLLPFHLSLPDGAVVLFVGKPALKLLIACLIVFCWFDVIRRYRRWSLSADRETALKTLFSPVVLFLVLVYSQTPIFTMPVVYDDDFHMGERFLGTWLYSKGTIPFIDYFPAHGIFHDDLQMLLARFFFDNSQADTFSGGIFLADFLLKFLVMVLLYAFSNSVVLALIAVFFCHFPEFCLMPFVLLFVNPSLCRRPGVWLAVWMVTIPLLILGMLAQGMALILASTPLAVHALYRLCKKRDVGKIDFISPVIAIVVLLALQGSIPLKAMLLGAIDYVSTNAAFNQINYGIPWNQSLAKDGSFNFIFEFSRMTWVFSLILFPLLYLHVVKKNRQQIPALLPGSLVFLLLLMLLPYLMGRIDPNLLSRVGSGSLYGWAVLLPVMTWLFLGSMGKTLLLVLIAFMASLLSLPDYSFVRMLAGVWPIYTTAALTDPRQMGIHNIGRSLIVSPQHWQRLLKINALLNRELTPEQTYLDLTGRNAHYYYFNRIPPVSVTAAYNMAPLHFQIDAVNRLKQNMPPLVLLEADNVNYQGGGISLRVPYLYRFVLDHYQIHFEDGLLFARLNGAQGTAQSESAEYLLHIKPDTNEVWHLGVHRAEPALLLEDLGLLRLLEPGTSLKFEHEPMTRTITRVEPQHSAIWFDGPIVAVQDQAPKVKVLLDQATVANFRTGLLDSKLLSSYQPLDLKNIPLSWGRSIRTLSAKMEPIVSLPDATVELNDLVRHDKGYRVTGANPSMIFDLAQFKVAGKDAGLLKFDFQCIDEAGLTIPEQAQSSKKTVDLGWTNRRLPEYGKNRWIRSALANGTLIVPLDAMATWLLQDKAEKIQIHFNLDNDCRSFLFDDAGLLQRRFVDR